MSLKLLQLIAAFAASAHGLAVPDSQGAAFSLDVLPSTAEEFDPVAERQRLEAKYPTTHDSSIQARTLKQSGSAKVKPVSGGLAFFVPTVVGNQTFNLIYDTGSADL
jgi:aspergillopepsin I